jgi:hypothetical protein
MICAAYSENPAVESFAGRQTSFNASHEMVIGDVAGAVSRDFLRTSLASCGSPNSRLSAKMSRMSSPQPALGRWNS